MGIGLALLGTGPLIILHAGKGEKFFFFHTEKLTPGWVGFYFSSLQTSKGEGLVYPFVANDILTCARELTLGSRMRIRVRNRMKVSVRLGEGFVFGLYSSGLLWGLFTTKIVGQMLWARPESR